MVAPDIAGRTELAITKPEALPQEVHKVVTDAIQLGCTSVMVPPVWVNRVATMARGSGLGVCAAVSFPSGFSKSTIKAIEATSCIKDAADQIAVVAYLPNLVRLDLDPARTELLEIVRAARSARRDVIIKVIVETALLLQLGDQHSEPAIECACRAVRESGCDAIITSTGYHSAGGATVEAVKLLRKYGEALMIQAGGSIPNDASARLLLDAGADRVGIEVVKHA